MDRIAHFPRRLLVAGLLIAPLAACGGEDSPDLMLTLVADSSNGDPVQVEFNVAGDTVTETVEGEWRLPVDVGDSFDLTLRVENVSGTGEVSCRITETPDEETADFGASGVDATGEGAAICEIAGTASGNTLSTTGTNYGLTQQEVDEGFEPDFGD